MSIYCRPMEPKDIRQCVEHIAAHPILGPRYGKLIVHLPFAIRFALENNFTFPLFEELEDSTTRLLGAGMGVFVLDEFLHEAKITPMFWVGPELVKRIKGGKRVFLSPAEVRDANSTTGLNLLVWQLTFHPKDILRTKIVTPVLSAFEQMFRGLRLREIFEQAGCVEHLDRMRYAGGLYFDRVRGACEDFPEVTVQNFSDEPRNVIMTRELASTYSSSWLASFFVSYAPPRLGLSQSEQKLLRAAEDGETDEQLSDRLGISIHAVKMRWRMIYDRAATCLPDLVADNSRVDGEVRGRGREKKQRLLDYVRKHPEELHPVSRKLLHQSAAQETSSYPSRLREPLSQV